jgi:hypothetical protein
MNRSLYLFRNLRDPKPVLRLLGRAKRANHSLGEGPVEAAPARTAPTRQAGAVVVAVL